MSNAYNKPYFLIKGKTSNKIETRRYYTKGGSNCKSFFPSKVRIDGKLEEYEILNSSSVPIWTYWQLQEIRDLAEFLNSACPEERQNCNVANLCHGGTEKNLKTFKKVCCYYSFFTNLECLLYRMYKIVFWKENDQYYMYKREDN